MTFSDQSYNLRIEFDQKGCDLPLGEIEKMETSLKTLGKVVERFPISNLYITVICHEPSQDFHVKTSLALPGKTLFTGDRDSQAYPAYERCIRKLVQKVRSYKKRMSYDSELAKQYDGTHQSVVPSGEFDLPTIQSAIADQDYWAFRQGLDVFDEPLRKRVGRWLQRYPEIESQLDAGFQIDDIVEEVFLNAFEKFPSRSHDVPPGKWLEHLIDPSVQAILQSPDEEFANISFARSMRGMNAD